MFNEKFCSERGAEVSGDSSSPLSMGALAPLEVEGCSPLCLSSSEGMQCVPLPYRKYGLAPRPLRAAPSLPLRPEGR